MGSHHKVVSGIQGINRLRLIKQHRLYEFEKTFDKYMKGEVSAAYLKERADKVKQIRT
jgi:hypothetical protein